MSNKKNPDQKENRSCTWIIILFAMISAIVFLTPIQHYISIGRAQHHGISIILFGLGFLVEALISAKHLNSWGIRAYIGTAALFGSVGITFIKIPWIYTNVSIETEENMQVRSFLLVVYLVAVAILTAIWIKWIIENNKIESKSQNAETKQSDRVKKAKEKEEGSN